jgi:hypothetical protein
MAHTYCSCGVGLEEPTLEEQITDELTCWNCGRSQQTSMSDAEILLTLLSRIEELEETVTLLKEV